MDSISSREIRLKRYPQGIPEAADFDLVETQVPAPTSGQVLVRNAYMSVDPYMRGRMIQRKSYAPPFELEQPLYGACVGEVVESNAAGLAPGDWVLGGKGWRDYFIAAADELTPIDIDRAPASAYLGVMGMPGMTAYVGLLDIGQARPGETVFVSAAAGAVGSAVCQIARIKGCKVVGSAGSDDKVAWLCQEAGVEAFNYKVDDLGVALAQACPEGVDVYFDNVGGAHLEAAIAQMNDNGRAALCGMIGQYNAGAPQAGPGNLMQMIIKRLRLQGFLVFDHQARRADFEADMSDWIATGQIKWRETVVEGLERAPEAFIGLFQGANTGKMVVKL